MSLRLLDFPIVDQLNPNTKKWFTKKIPLLEGDGYIRSSPGFLMGMLNAASSTVGLCAANYHINRSEQSATILRSSDDSMIKFVANGPTAMSSLIETNRRALKCLGINMSTTKSFIFKDGFGEYTSWYMEGDFLAQYGVETASLRPQAQNPQD